MGGALADVVPDGELFVLGSRDMTVVIATVEDCSRNAQGCYLF
jgi:hypothetical protein